MKEKTGRLHESSEKAAIIILDLPNLFQSQSSHPIHLRWFHLIANLIWEGLADPSSFPCQKRNPTSVTK